ncbi:ATP-binding protein [Fulvivirga sediminis]|uniref:ATP-binding protein n=1 Tax=Fulvivirga sediminis TaxID=2803949 RepID=A0A937F5S6_9BACT|nr:ATP-binding protein [Fulvivirga sediminis]MBL3655531.1 ATP-binding protein [Fulvivirga sediminis]
MDERNFIGGMVMTQKINIEEQATVLTQELDWLSHVISVRLALHFEQETNYLDISELPVPDLRKKGGSYANFVNSNELNPAERLVLILALVPHIQPSLLDVLLTKNHDYDRRYSEFGGILMDGHLGLIPTAETAMFIIAGENIYARLHYQYIFKTDHVFYTSRILDSATNSKNSPRLSGKWLIANEYVDFLTCGQEYTPVYGADFPAQRVDTSLNWDDVVLNRKTMESLREIQYWAEYEEEIMQDLGMGRRLKPGYKSLFYGPPGTGKTMTAALLGKSTGRPVYRIDLSMVVSKYIGETEKNLAKVFDYGEKQKWILFFDEADSLFGKRTQVNTANDRYGNQEIGYLLQRIEDFSGLVILASNLKENIDEAFTRRFQSMIEFRMPGVAERHQLWQQSFSQKLPLEAEIDLWDLAEKYEIAGGVMMNVVRKSTLRALKAKRKHIIKKELNEAIQQELYKEGIIMS